MLPAKPAYFIIYVADMTTSLKFCRDTLGLPVKFETPYRASSRPNA